MPPGCTSSAFKIGTLQHGLECLQGRRRREARPHVGASIFTDWWAYKFEVIDAIPENAAILHEQAVTVSFNSDSNELARRLNTEAAKAVKYGGVAEADALKFVTLHPARQLGIDDRVGSIEPGKDADLALWSAPPLSSYARCERTLIDGRCYWSRDDDARWREAVRTERTRIVQIILGLDEADREGERPGSSRGRTSAMDNLPGECGCCEEEVR